MKPICSKLPVLVVPKLYDDVPLMFRKRPTNNYQQQNKNPQKPQKKNKQTNNSKNQTPRRNQWNRCIITRCSEKWCDKVTCVPSTEQAIRWKQQEENQKQHRMGRLVPSKKVAMPKPRIPPARIPEIAMRGRAGMTSTNAHRPRRFFFCANASIALARSLCKYLFTRCRCANYCK